MEHRSPRELITLLLVFLVFPLAIATATGVREPLPVQENYSHVDGPVFTIVLPAGDDPIEYRTIQASDADSLLVLGALHEGLYTFDPETSLPRLAMAQSAEISDDGLVWTITLHSGLHYSNGDLLFASDFIDSWLWLLSVSRNLESAFLVSLLDVVQGARAYRLGLGTSSEVGLEAVNNTTIRISLVSPAPYLPSMLCNPVFAAQHPRTRAMHKESDPVSMIYSGPFIPASTTAQEILLERNPWYRDVQSIASDWIKIRFLDPGDIAAAYLDGSCDWTPWFLPFQMLKDTDDLVLGLQYATGFYYFCNPSGPWSDPAIRMALALLAPWEEVSLVAGELFITDTLVPGSNAQTLASSIPDNTEAKRSMAMELLKSAGYPAGKGLPQLSIGIPRGNRIEKATHVLAEALSLSIGITIVLDVVPLSVYSARPSENPYDLAFITWIADFQDPFAFLHLWQSDSSYNLGNFSDPQFDLLVNQALQQSDRVQRSVLMEQAESLLLTQAVVFPVMHGLSTHIIDSKHITGWFANPLDIHPLKYLRTSR